MRDSQIASAAVALCVLVAAVAGVGSVAAGRAPEPALEPGPDPGPDRPLATGGAADPTDPLEGVRSSQDNGTENGSTAFERLRSRPGAGALVVGAVETRTAALENAVSPTVVERALANATTDGRRAAVAGRFLDAGLARLDDLAARKAELDRAHENGTLSDAVYHVRTSRLASVARDLRDVAAVLNATVADLPPDLRETQGLNRTRIRGLGRGADRLVGDSVRAFDESFYADVSGMVAEYNEHAADSTTVVDSLLAGERVTLYVTYGPVVKPLSFEVTRDGRIREFRAGGRADATLLMWVDRGTMRDVINAENPQAAFGRAVENGDVRVRGVGTVGRLKWLAVDVVRTGIEIVAGAVDAVGDALAGAADAVGDFLGSL